MPYFCRTFHYQTEVPLEKRNDNSRFYRRTEYLSVRRAWSDIAEMYVFDEAQRKWQFFQMCTARDT